MHIYQEGHLEYGTSQHNSLFSLHFAEYILVCTLYHKITPYLVEFLYTNNINKHEIKGYLCDWHSGGGWAWP